MYEMKLWTMSCSSIPVQLSHYKSTERLLKRIRLDPCSQKASCLVAGMKGKAPESYCAPYTVHSSLGNFEIGVLISDRAEESNWPSSCEFSYSSASHQILSGYCPPRPAQTLAECGKCYNRGANKGLWEQVVFMFPVASFSSQGLCQPCHLSPG